MYKYIISDTASSSICGKHCRMTCASVDSAQDFEKSLYCFSTFYMHLNGVRYMNRWHGCDTHTIRVILVFTSPSIRSWTLAVLSICPFPQWQITAGADIQNITINYNIRLSGYYLKFIMVSQLYSNMTQVLKHHPHTNRHIHF